MEIIIKYIKSTWIQPESLRKERWHGKFFSRLGKETVSSVWESWEETGRERERAGEGKIKKNSWDK